jgi:hypothetical protein
VHALWVRLFARSPTGPLELPVLRHGRQLVRGSFQIVQHAEREGARARLIPDVTAVVRWNELSDRAIVAGHSFAQASLRRVLEELSAALAGVFR